MTESNLLNLLTSQKLFVGKLQGYDFMNTISNSNQSGGDVLFINYSQRTSPAIVINLREDIENYKKILALFMLKFL